jgi:RNA exonuclease 1
MVRLAQKQGMKGTKGGWKEFLKVHDKEFGASLSDPTKRSNDVLLAFLKSFVKEDDLKVIHILG